MLDLIRLDLPLNILSKSIDKFLKELGSDEVRFEVCKLGFCCLVFRFFLHYEIKSALLALLSLMFF